MKTIGTSTKLFAIIGLLALGSASHAQFITYNPTNTAWQTVANERIDPTVTNGASFTSLTAGTHTINFGATAVAGVIGDTQARPIVVAMVAKPRSGQCELGEQGPLGSGWHSVRADQRSAVAPPAVRGDGDQIGILAYENLLSRHVPGGR